MAMENENETPQQRMKWQEANVEDFQAITFEEPVVRLTACGTHAYVTAYQDAARGVADVADARGQAAHHVFEMMAAVMGMRHVPTETHQPFAPMISFSDGSRSAIPEDFRGPPLEALSFAAERAAHPVVRARLCDVCWLLNRRRGDLGRAAITAYVEIASRLTAGTLQPPFDDHGPTLLECTELLTRALAIGRAIEWDGPEAVSARELLLNLQRNAGKAPYRASVLKLYDLSIRFGVSEPAAVGAAIEALLAGDKSAAFESLEFWRTAARAYRRARDQDSVDRCLIRASDCLVAQADFFSQKSNSTMISAHWLSQAIAQLHGVRGIRDRRDELQRKLVEVQSGIAHEMAAYSHKVDLSKSADAVRKGLDGRSLLEMLLMFADLDSSPDPAKLKRDAEENIKQHPLTSLFATSHHDDEGKVVHRSEGGGFGVKHDASAIKAQIAQAESIRRQLLVGGGIEAARCCIVDRFYPGEDVFYALLQHSPFVPPDLLHTFSLGFARFFVGDFVSAVYILTPMLENSLRHLLKAHGHDVTKFEDADETQQDHTISALFLKMRKQLDAIFGEELTADIENLFLTKPGPYLRHSVAHGLMHDGTPYGPDAHYGCWLIFRLCCIPLFADTESIRLPE